MEMYNKCIQISLLLLQLTDKSTSSAEISVVLKSENESPQAQITVFYLKNGWHSCPMPPFVVKIGERSILNLEKLFAAVCLKNLLRGLVYIP